MRVAETTRLGRAAPRSSRPTQRRARAQDGERVEDQLDVAAEIAAAVAGSERIAVG